MAKDIVAFLDEIKKIHKRSRIRNRPFQDNLYSPDLKKSYSEKKNDFENCSSTEYKSSNLLPISPVLKSSDSPKTEPSTPLININDRYREMEELSSLELDNIEEERGENNDIFMETPFEGILNQGGINCLKLFDWGECDNFLKSSEL